MSYEEYEQPKTILGRLIPRKSLVARIYFGVSVISALIILVLQSYLFTVYIRHLQNANKDNKARTIATFLALFIFSEVYQVVLSYEALLNENTIQIFLLSFFYAAMCVYSGIQYYEIQNTIASYLESDWRTATKASLIAVICVMCITFSSETYLAFLLYKEFGWSMFKHIGADLQMRNRYIIYQIYCTLLKFDFFFFLAFTIQFCVIMLKTHDVEFALTIAVIPLTMIILVCAYFFARLEISHGMMAVIFLYFCALAYFLFKLVRMYTKKSETVYKSARKSLTTFAALTIFCLILTIITAVKVQMGFNHSLKRYTTGIKHEANHQKQCSDAINLNITSPTNSDNDSMHMAQSEATYSPRPNPRILLD